MDNIETRAVAAVIDMETTGLDAHTDVPLELGIKIIDKEGFVLQGRQWLVNEDVNEDFQAAIERGKKNPFVGPMHTESGLWDALDDDEFPGLSRKTVDREASEFLEEFGLGDGRLPMMGNSIGSLDRPFCIVHFPRLNDTLSYRNVDMSSIKEIMKWRNPVLFKNLEPIISNKSTATHRVFEDIDACILEYRAYCDNFFFIED